VREFVSSGGGVAVVGDIVVAKALQMPPALDTQAIRKGRRGEWCTAAMRAANHWVLMSQMGQRTKPLAR
jgi:hypothetical protein